MTGVEVFIDDTPGETRGILVRNGSYERLIIHRDDDRPEHRLGAVSLGRVAKVDAALSAAFVDLGGGEPLGFLPIGRAIAVKTGQKIEVQVVAEPRETKGPTLALIGDGAGDVRLITAGPDVAARLAALAPGVEPGRGLAAIQASLEAEDEAMATRFAFAGVGIDLAVERTRALVAVDIDYAGQPGRDVGRSKAQANRRGLVEAARLIRLNNWAGLVCVDLIGGAQDGEAVLSAAKAAFGSDKSVAFGPISRFGLLQLTLPWRDRPVEEIVMRGAASVQSRAVDLTRRLRREMLTNTAASRLTLRCSPDEAIAVAPLVVRLGPRAQIIADPAALPGAARIEEA